MSSWYFYFLIIESAIRLCEKFIGWVYPPRFEQFAHRFHFSSKKIKSSLATPATTERFVSLSNFGSMYMLKRFYVEASMLIWRTSIANINGGPARTMPQTELLYRAFSVHLETTHSPIHRVSLSFQRFFVVNIGVVQYPELSLLCRLSR